MIRERRPRNILEIGTANGYSTLCFAEALEKPFDTSSHSTITTIEHSWSAHIEAVEHFKNCKMKYIHAIWGDAKAVIPTLADEYFDCIFIDAMKREYLDYLLLSIPKLTPDALIIIDDVEKFRAKMEHLYAWLDKNAVSYKRKKTDSDDSIMIIERNHIAPYML